MTSFLQIHWQFRNLTWWTLYKLEFFWSFCKLFVHIFLFKIPHQEEWFLSSPLERGMRHPIYIYLTSNNGMHEKLELRVLMHNNTIEIRHVVIQQFHRNICCNWLVDYLSTNISLVHIICLYITCWTRGYKLSSSIIVNLFLMCLRAQYTYLRYRKS